MDLGWISRIVDILTGCRFVHYRFSRDRMVHGVDQWTRPILHRSEPERRKSSLAESTEYGVRSRPHMLSHLKSVNPEMSMESLSDVRVDVVAETCLLISA